MQNLSFDAKWGRIKAKPASAEESSLFVDDGNEPETQRQLNLYYYFLFIKNILTKTNARSVLEVGCGRGTMSLYLSKYIGLDVTLLDDSENAIKVAEGLFNAHRQKASFHVRDALHTGLPDESFDAVISIGLAEHFSDMHPLFDEQYRLLKKGGIMISLNIPQKFSVQILNIIMRRIKKVSGSYVGDIKRDYYRNSYAPQKYARVAQAAGFRDISVTHVTPFPLFVPVSAKTDRYIATFYKKILFLRGLFQDYPYKTNQTLSLAHFLVGYKR